MKDAIGSTMLFYLIVIVVGIIGSIIISSNAYTKAYKAKNAIITVIDKYYKVQRAECDDYEKCIDDIDTALTNLGYQMSGDNVCNDLDVENANLIYPKENETFRGYCIFATELSEEGSGNNDKYYTIVTFSHLNVSLVGTLFKKPVYGETRVYNYKYIEE